MNNKLIKFLVTFFLFQLCLVQYGQDITEQNSKKNIIFAYGGQLNSAFIKYVADLTKKDKPKICFLPTAARDSEKYINFWFETSNDLELIPYTQRVWISSYVQSETFEDILLSMDAIIVGGGNTLKMLAIWKAQGIDSVLIKAYEKGIVLAGGSAGSLCWFNAGITDSRPKDLSIVEGLNFLDFSHCPHYSNEEGRRPLYQNYIIEGKLADGYACDENSGIVFINGKYYKTVSLDDKNNSYYVYLKNGRVKEEKLESEIIE